MVGKLKAFALKADCGYQKVTFLQTLLEGYPIVNIIRELTGVYARIDAYSQGKLKGQPLSDSLTSRNMGKNDLWIAATALFLDLPLYTTDNDFDHLPAYGLRLLKHS